MPAANRAILLTGPGAGAIAVIRLIGPGVGAFLAAHFSRSPRVGRCVHGELRDGRRILDDPVIVLIDGQTADVNLHGGPWVVRGILELAERAGFKLDTHHSDEGRLDAVEGDDLLEREAMAVLSMARTDLAVRSLLAQPAAWPGELRALLEAPSAPLPSELRIQAQRIVDDWSLWRLLHPPRVALVGIPNSGKSTLANQLFAQERSIVADLPGTTRDWVGELANIDGLSVLLLDTPGVRDAADSIESRAIARSAEQIAGADLKILLLDATQDLAAQQALIAAHPAGLIVLNKSDLPPIWNPTTVAALDPLPVIAITGQGVGLLRRRIAGYFGCSDMDLSRPRWWTMRQRRILLDVVATTATG